MRAVIHESKERKSMQTQPVNENYSSVRVNDTAGTAFLGILAILMLVFLVRANRRNRELLLEVISLRRQS
jgi:hypothetical protein